VNDPERSSEDGPQGDPWRAFAYTVSGVAVYGLIGYLLDRWLGTSFLVAVGICAGAAMGIYMTWARFNKPAPPKQHQQHTHDDT
jgi:ATP synthase protein I